jgi:hypothetical protein
MATVTSSKRHLLVTSDTYTSNGDVTVGGDLFVNGSQTTINTATLDVEDKNITLNYGGNEASSQGSGITIAGSNATLIWDEANTRWTFSDSLVITDHAKMTSGNASGKFAVKSTDVHASYDFYNDGTSYFNGAVTIDADLTLSGGVDILMSDNAGAAVEFKQGTDLYMRFITTNGGEHIEVNKNMEIQGLTATAGSFSSTLTAGGRLTINRESQHITQTNISANNAHLDLFNTWESDTDQKGSIITFTDNYYGSSSYNKTLRAAIKGGTDSTGNTADGYLEFYTDSGGANSPNLVLRLDKSKNAEFKGNIVMAANATVDGVDISGLPTSFAPTDAEANVQADWNETTTTSDAYIKNKPSTFTPSTHNHDGRYLRTHARYSDDLDTITTSGVYIWDVSEADDEPTGAADGLLTIKYWDSSSWATASFQDFHNRTLHIKSKKNGTWQTDWAQVWTTDQLTTTNKTNYDTAYTHSQAAHAPSDAEANVQADWDETTTTSDAFILNKPTIPTDFVSAANGGTFADSISVHGNILLTGAATTTNADRTIDFTGFDKEGVTDFTDSAKIRHTTNHGGHAGSVLDISSQNDSGDGIAFTTHSSSLLKHNGNAIFSEGHKPTWSEIESKPSTFAPSSHTHTFASLTSKPTTLSGYGITDAVKEYINHGTEGDHEMHTWNKIHATYNDNSSGNTYWLIETNVPQSSYSMGGFEIIYENDYADVKDGGKINVFGYWNPESNSGFLGFKYTTDNPNLASGLTFKVGANSSGKVCFLMSGSDQNYTQIIAQNLWLGYNANSAAASWGDSWSISNVSSHSITNLDDVQKTPDARWDNIQGKPSTFAPSAHNQAWTTITGTPTTLSGYGITDTIPTDFVSAANGGTFSGDVTVNGDLLIGNTAQDPKNIVISQIGVDNSETSSLMLDGNGVVVLRNLGSGAFASTPTDFVSAANGGTFSGTVTASGGINGLTLTNGISGSNFNISGVNQLQINDPGEGIVFGGGSAGDISLAVVDDSNDNLLRITGTGVKLQVGSNEVYHEGHKPTYTELGTMAYTNLTGAPTIPSGDQLVRVYNNQDYIASGGTSGDYRDNYGAGVTIYEGYNTGANRPHTYDTTAQFMSNTNQGFELSIDWVNASTTPLKIRSLRDCCQGWNPWTNVWTSHNFTLGTGGGLDADKVDGKHAADFAPATHYHDSRYVRLDINQTLGQAYNFTNTGNQFKGHLYYNSHDSNGNHYYHYRVGSTASSGTTVNFRQYYNASSYITHTWKATSASDAYFDFVGELRPNKIKCDGEISAIGDIKVGSTTDGAQRVLRLYSYASDSKHSTIKTTNGNLHIDSEDGHSLYLNYYEGASTNIYFGTGNGGYCGTVSSAGLLRMANDVVAYYSFSDRRLKTNIKTTENNLEKILSLNPVEYTWKEGPREGVKEIGLIAQEVEEVVPEVVRVQSRHHDEKSEGEEYKQVDYEHLVSTLIGAMQEQQKQIDELKAQMAACEERACNCKK